METDFPCTKCGACCRLIPDDALKYYNLPRSKHGGCDHILPDNTCKIYDTRPDVCNVKIMWTNVHSKNITWEEYKTISEELCIILEGIYNKQKEQIE